MARQVRPPTCLKRPDCEKGPAPGPMGGKPEGGIRSGRGVGRQRDSPRETMPLAVLRGAVLAWLEIERVARRAVAGRSHHRAPGRDGDCLREGSRARAETLDGYILRRRGYACYPHNRGAMPCVGNGALHRRVVRIGSCRLILNVVRLR
jgi:hypothetical protein